MFLPFSKGFAIGGGLIVAIGAQNAFVLSQGVRRNRPLLIALICACCDAVLILLGVTGVGNAVANSPLLTQAAIWGGVLFLAYYGCSAFHAAWRGHSMNTTDDPLQTRGALITATLAVTLLNPHVYLDTIFLLGSISTQLDGSQRPIFACGAISASFLWFFLLSYGAGLLAPLFRKKSAWRILDGCVGLIMWGFALSLLTSQIAPDVLAISAP
ncbi:MAG: amino acid transporter [Desulfuromonas sp.]|nr:MAG: amino acid transporter [Desulfuromonas sp.]